MIDAFTHFTPTPVLERFESLAPELPTWAAFRKLPALWDLPTRLSLLDGFPQLQQVLSLGNPPVELLGSPQVAADLARAANEELARTCANEPDRFPTFLASLPLSDVAASVAELDHAVSSLGARGVQLYTNVTGRPLSDSIFRPIFERAHAHDVPIFLHPFRTAQFSDYASEAESQDEIWFSFGWPYETAACVTRLIYSRLFDDLPGVKLVAHHMGGVIPYLTGKITLGFEQIFSGDDDQNPLAQRAGLVRPLLDYYKLVFADTALNGATAALRCGLEFFGTSHTLFATDAPFSPDNGASIIENTLRSINELSLAPDGYHAVTTGNAKELLALT